MLDAGKLRIMRLEAVRLKEIRVELYFWCACVCACVCVSLCWITSDWFPSSFPVGEQVCVRERQKEREREKDVGRFFFGFLNVIPFLEKLF